MSDRASVVLVHGFGGGERDYRGVTRYLDVRKYPVDFYSFSYKKRFGQVPLVEIADELARYVRANLHEKRFHIIGFSQGGLIARALAKRYPDLARQVDTIVTVCTPHHGSLLAYLMVGKGVADLRPGSTFLKDIQGDDGSIAYYAVYNPLDLIVIPGTSARFEEARINKRVIAPSHFLTFGSRKTVELVESVLFPIK